jgi:hypothetical protein
MTRPKAPLLEPGELPWEQRRELAVQAYISNIDANGVPQLSFRKAGKKFDVYWQAIQRRYEGRLTRKEFAD